MATVRVGVVVVIVVPLVLVLVLALVALKVLVILLVQVLLELLVLLIVSVHCIGLREFCFGIRASSRLLAGRPSALDPGQPPGGDY